MFRVGEGLEPRLGDHLLAFLASAVGPRVDPGQGLVDLAQGVLVVLDQAQGEFLVVVLGPDVGHVERDVREVPGGVGLARRRASSVIWSRSPRSLAWRPRSESR